MVFISKHQCLSCPLSQISFDWPLIGSARTTGSSVSRRRKRASTITMTNRFFASFWCLHDIPVLTLILFTFAGTSWWENGVEEAQRVKIRHWYNFVDIVNIWICQLYRYWQYWKVWNIGTVKKEYIPNKRFHLRPSSDKNIHSNLIPDCAIAANKTFMVTIQQVYLHWKVELTLVSFEQINQVTKANNWSMLFVNNSKWINIWQDNVWWIIGTSISKKLEVLIYEVTNPTESSKLFFYFNIVDAWGLHTGCFF